MEIVHSPLPPVPPRKRSSPSSCRSMDFGDEALRSHAGTYKRRKFGASSDAENSLLFSPMMTGGRRKKRMLERDDGDSCGSGSEIESLRLVFMSLSLATAGHILHPHLLTLSPSPPLYSINPPPAPSGPKSVPSRARYQPCEMTPTTSQLR